MCLRDRDDRGPGPFRRRRRRHDQSGVLEHHVGQGRRRTRRTRRSLLERHQLHRPDAAAQRLGRRRLADRAREGHRGSERGRPRPRRVLGQRLWISRERAAGPRLEGALERAERRGAGRALRLRRRRTVAAARHLAEHDARRHDVGAARAGLPRRGVHAVDARLRHPLVRHRREQRDDLRQPGAADGVVSPCHLERPPAHSRRRLQRLGGRVEGLQPEPDQQCASLSAGRRLSRRVAHAAGIERRLHRHGEPRRLRIPGRQHLEAHRLRVDAALVPADRHPALRGDAGRQCVSLRSLRDRRHSAEPVPGHDRSSASAASSAAATASAPAAATARNRGVDLAREDGGQRRHAAEDERLRRLLRRRRHRHGTDRFRRIGDLQRRLRLPPVRRPRQRYDGEHERRDRLRLQLLAGRHVGDPREERV